MRLLVSVADAEDARAAVEGGADIVDAKDPAQGALGPVAPATLEAIVQAVDGARPVSAAVGDALVARPDGDRARALLALIAVASGPGARGQRPEVRGQRSEARSQRPEVRGEGQRAEAGEVVALPGLAFIKMGFGPGLGRLRAMAHAAAVVDAACTTSCGVVLAGYADAGPDHLACDAVIEIALRCGAVGVLIDTLDKRGPGLFATASSATVARWVGAAHDGGLSIALAGSLGVGDVERVRDLDADILGVRGSVCDGGRGGRVSIARVRELATTQDQRQRRELAQISSARSNSARTTDGSGTTHTEC
jgi:(5-formylfuran-3-yl)methyl phosphate synthase